MAALEQKVADQQRVIDELRAQHENLGHFEAPKADGDGQTADGQAADGQAAGGQGTSTTTTTPPPPVAAPKRPLVAATVYSVPLGPSPVIGNPKAKVTMVMAGEFACPFCRKAWDTVEELRKTYGNDLRVAYKSFIVHPKYATIAAQAACAAHRQRKFKPMADLLWAKAFDAQDDPHSFERENIDRIAAEAGLDLKRYNADMAGTCPSEVVADQDAMRKLGVSGTPTFFINGRLLPGAQPLGAFTVVIDEELAKANAAIKTGVKPERYYDQEIVAKGVKEPAAAPSPYGP
jgi:protein-disulfide isomerase